MTISSLHVENTGLLAELSWILDLGCSVSGLLLCIVYSDVLLLQMLIRPQLFQMFLNA